MKKILSLLLVIALVFISVSFSAYATEENPDYPIDETFIEGDYEYAIRDDGTAEIRDYFGEAENLTLPSKLNEYTVSKLAIYSLSECENLETVVIPDTVTAIADGVFSGCTSLKKVEIPDTVTIIGAWCFADCFSLESIVIPKGVTKITHNAFSRCNKLTSIKVSEDNKKYDSRNNCNAVIETKTNTLLFGCKSSVIPDTVTSIGADAFSCCYLLKSINIPNSVKSIGENAFLMCTSLESVVIPDSIETVGEWAFAECTSLSSVKISNKLTAISGWMFSNCSSLSSVAIPASVETIDQSAFVDCSSLLQVSIPESVERVGDWAFCNCSSLSAVELPESLKSIGEGAFSNCTALKSVVIPKNVSSIGYGAFYGSLSDYVVVLNAECEIKNDADYSDTFMSKTLIYGIKDSTAHQYAEIRDMAFEPYCQAPNFTHDEIVIEGIPATDFESGLTDGLQCGICDEMLKAQQEVKPLIGFIGDVDMDSDVTILDATAVQLYIAQLETLSQTQALLADTDNDKEISIIDVTLIQLFVAHIIDEF